MIYDLTIYYLAALGMAVANFSLFTIHFSLMKVARGLFVVDKMVDSGMVAADST